MGDSTNNTGGNPSGKLLSVFSLVLITVGSVDSIRNLSSIALFGSSLIFFFIIATIFFLLPITLISAELSTTWPEQGGIYVWVKHAFGKQFGFLAIWFQWIENVIWYPTILSFSAATLGYLISPSLATNKIFLVCIILTAFWGTTAINLFGVRNSMRFSSFCTLIGLLLPMMIIIGLGASWVISGKPLQLSFNSQSMFPNFHNPQMWMALTGTMMSFCGLEIATVHAHAVNQPHRAFPRALFISILILLFTQGCGSLVIALVLPNKDINLLTGIVQICSTFLTAYNLQWIMPFMIVIIIIGTVGTLCNWILAPSTGLSIAALEGNLPQRLARRNRRHSPHNILILQAIVVTLLMLVFLLIPNVSDSYWLLTVITTQLYMLMYIIMFAAALYLRFKHPNQHRPFRIPGKNFGILIVAAIGIVGALTTLIAGFVPPTDMHQPSQAFSYETMLAAGLIIMSLPPFILYRLKYRFIETKKI